MSEEREKIMSSESETEHATVAEELETTEVDETEEEETNEEEFDEEEESEEASEN